MGARGWVAEEETPHRSTGLPALPAPSAENMPLRPVQPPGTRCARQPLFSPARSPCGLSRATVPGLGSEQDANLSQLLSPGALPPNCLLPQRLLQPGPALVGSMHASPTVDDDPLSPLFQAAAAKRTHACAGLAAGRSSSPQPGLQEASGPLHDGGRSWGSPGAVVAQEHPRQRRQQLFLASLPQDTPPPALLQLAGDGAAHHAGDSPLPASDSSDLPPLLL